MDIAALHYEALQKYLLAHILKGQQTYEKQKRLCGLSIRAPLWLLHSPSCYLLFVRVEGHSPGTSSAQVVVGGANAEYN